MDELSQGPYGPSSFASLDYPADLLGGYSSYQSLKEAITNYLIGLAKVGSKCSFRQLYTALNIPLVVTYSWHRKLISQLCHEINRDQYHDGKPLIGVLLCGESDGYITGMGFFDLMDYSEFCEGFTFDKSNKHHRAAFFGIHARKCWIYWSKQRKQEEKRWAATQRHQVERMVPED